MIRTISFLLAGAAALAAAPAAAQDREEDMLIVSPGVGAQLLPAYPGASEYSVAPLFGGHVRREGEPIPFRGPDDGFGFSLTGRDGPIEFGPMIQFQGERSEEDVTPGLEEVDFTFEPGLFLNIKISPNFRLRAEGRRGFGGHEGWLGDIGADFAIRGGPESIFTIGPRLRLADSEYMRTYFGVTPAAATATGLAAYDPDGGVRAIGVMSSLTHQLGRNWGVYAYAGYDRLVGDAADSPIVRVLGSRDQFMGGIALYYSFRMRNPF